MSEELFNQKGIEKFLKERARIIFFDEIDSTSNEAKLLLSVKNASSLHKTVIVAAFQSSGRGRMCGRKFYSPKGSGVYLSMIWERPLLHPSLVTPYAALSVIRAIESVYGIESKIKWVNDIYVDGKKVSGILTEAVATKTGIESFVIGIGVNVFVKNLPSDIENVAGGIIREGEDTKLNQIAACIIDNLLALLEREDSGAMEEYKAKSNVLNKKIKVFPLIGSVDGSYEAVAIDIDNEAKLVVKTDNGEERHLDSGEISIKLY